jgi:hypothetical protein
MADPIPVPSGQTVTLLDVVLNAPGPAGAAARFRFVAPGIADGSVDFDTAAADMEALCRDYALPRVAGTVPPPQQIIISLSAAPVTFGAQTDVVQYFEAYRIEGDTCIWEIF